MAIELTQNGPSYLATGSVVTADSPVPVPVPENAPTHQVTLAKGTATAGTITLTAKPVGASARETCYDENGTAIVYNAATSAAQITYTFDNRLTDFYLVIAGGNGTFLCSFSGMER